MSRCVVVLCGLLFPMLAVAQDEVEEIDLGLDDFEIDLGPDDGAAQMTYSGSLDHNAPEYVPGKPMTITASPSSGRPGS